jgi:signal transduction histidine kinase
MERTYRVTARLCMATPDPATDQPPAYRVACLGASPAAAATVVAAVASLLPEAQVDQLDFRATSGLPEADLFVIDAASDAGLAVEQLRTLRGRGAGAPAILVGGGELTVPASLGDHWTVDATQLAAALPNAISAAAGRAEAVAAHPGLGSLLHGLQAMQQLIAAGQIARRVKHDINNPLAALLAEAQLLELEELGDEARDSVVRMIELTRRVIDEARNLEGPRGGVVV